MKNKTQNMYGKLAAILMTVVLLTAGLSCTALAAGGNILTTIKGFDPTFESYVVEGENGEITYTKPAEASGSAVTIGEGNGSATSLKLGAKGDTIAFMAPVEPEKNYTFSFWMRNSKPGSLQLQGGASASAFYVVPGYYGGTNRTNPYLFVNANTCTTADGTITKYLDFMHRQRTAYLGDQGSETNYVFGIARDGEAAEAWRQVSINFTVPPAPVGFVRLQLACIVEDGMLALDDLSLVETGYEPNFIYNGNMEAFRNDREAKELSNLGYTTGTAYDTQIVTDPVTQNTYLTVRYIANDTKIRNNWRVLSDRAIFTQGKSRGTRYKISYKAKAEGDLTSSANVIELRDTKSSSNKYEYPIGVLTNDWKTYTLYLDATKMAANATAIFDFNTWFANYAYKAYTLCIDEVSSWWDETNIGFYEAIDLKYAGENDRYYDFVANYNDAQYKDIIMLESSKEATSISDLPESRTVKVRAHYLPTATWGSDAWEATTATFNPTTVTLLSSVYKYEKDANGNETKTLVNVKIASGTSGANGETIDVVGEITVPKAVGSERYEVEAIALDMNTLKPIAEKAILK